MGRPRLRSRREVVERCVALGRTLRSALTELDESDDDPRLASDVWQGEGLGILLWALQLVELPPYDRPFDHARLVETRFEKGTLRPVAEIDRARAAAQLWHWRARTAALAAGGEVEPPPRWASFEQLVAATAMRGHEQGLLPRPLRGDFPAFGTGYRHLSREQQHELHLIAWERHRALNWLCGLGRSWDEVPTDT